MFRFNAIHGCNLHALALGSFVRLLRIASAVMPPASNKTREASETARHYAVWIEFATRAIACYEGVQRIVLS
jgi:hypothetical protein